MELTLPYIFIIAVALGVDAFSVAVSVGVTSCRMDQVCRMSGSFGFFQFIMPVIGWFLGKGLIQVIGCCQGWIAFLILLIIGINMLKESFKKEEEKIECDRTTGWTLLGLSVATSIDALGVGISMGTVGADLWLAAVVIGIVAAVMTLWGMLLGKKLSETFGKRMETVAAVVLILLSFKMLTV